METKVKKPAGLWLKLTVSMILLLGICVGYGFVSSGGHNCFPAISFSADKSYTLTITGASGLRFCGVVSVKMADGKMAQHSLDGVVPETFEVIGKSVSVSFRKCEEDGSLNVVIANDGRSTVKGVTRESYGTVNIGLN